MSDYSKGKIYCLYSENLNEVYVGSTTNSLCERLAHHNHHYKNDNQKKTTSCILYNYGEKICIKLLENFPCNSKNELELKEREWIEKTENCVNKLIPTRDWKERRANNIEAHNQYMKKYREENAEAIKEKEKAYKEANKQKASEQHKIWVAANAERIKANRQTIITCEVCGEQTSKGNKWRHDKNHK